MSLAASALLSPEQRPHRDWLFQKVRRWQTSARWRSWRLPYIRESVEGLGSQYLSWTGHCMQNDSNRVEIMVHQYFPLGIGGGDVLGGHEGLGLLGRRNSCRPDIRRLRASLRSLLPRQIARHHDVDCHVAAIRSVGYSDTADASRTSPVDISAAGAGAD